jgi:hypothetical protein
MTTKHTPGPWAVRFYERHETAVIKTADGDEVATVDVKCMPDAPADARLIAAAPDLLEACEAFVVAMDSAHDHIERSIALMEKAIAKAKGETT